MQPALQAQQKVAILIVDDRPENILALTSILSGPEYEIVAAQSGADALRCLLRQEFALLLLDVMMPGMDGFELATIIKENERHKATPIIFLTAMATDVGFIYKGYSSGAVDYLTKPLEPNIVKAKVSVFVELYRQRERIKFHERREREYQLAEHQRKSEKRYRSLAEAIPAIVWTASPSGEPQYFNRRWQEYTGLSGPNADSGWEQARKVFFPEEMESFLQRWQQHVKLGTSFQQECRLRSANDGSYRWHLCRAVPEIGDDGKMVGWLGTFTDIDDQKKTEEAQRFLANASSILASSLDYQTTLSSMARLAVRPIADWCMIDILEDDLHPRRVEVAHWDSSKLEVTKQLLQYAPDPSAQDGIAKVLRTGQPLLIPDVTDEWLESLTVDAKHLELIKSLGLCSYLCVPLIARGQTLGAITLATAEKSRRYSERDLDFALDIARRASISIDNSRLYRDAQEMNRLKDEFIATLSHELRTPLNAIYGFTQQVDRQRLDDETRAIFEIIERNELLLMRLIEDILDVSRIIRGQLRLDLEKAPMDSVIQTAVEALQPAAAAKNIVIEQQIEPTEATVDAARIQQVVWNLLSNAVKFTTEGGRVLIRLTREEREMILTVEDSGMGIDPSFLPFIFERFRQADGSITRKHGGLGLGLAIARHLVELHGGHIKAQSPGIGHGAIFRVTLPFLTEPPRVEGLAKDNERKLRDQENRSIPTEGSSPISESLQGIKVLVVDDEADNRLLVSKILKRAGAEVTGAASAREAFEKLLASCPDVLLSDIGLPEEDGYVFIRKLKAMDDKQFASIPAAALTAYARDEEKDQALAAGFEMHLTKPVSAGALLQAVSSLANKARMAGASHPLA